MNTVGTQLPDTLFRLPLHDYYERSHVPLVERDGWLLPGHFRAMEEEMTLLERNDALVDFSDHGLLRLEGKDSVDFLNRISTNDFRNFHAGDSGQTILTTEKGRVIDSIVVVHRQDHLLLIASRRAQDSVRQWIEKFIIAEDVRVIDQTGNHILFADFLPQRILAPSGEESACTAFRVKYFDVDIAMYYCESGTEVPEIIRPLMVNQVGNDAFELFCVQRGIPQFWNEIMREFNPLELNLWNQISFNKGCYIGQEVIARLDTYKRIQRTLCRIRAEGRLLPDKEYRLQVETKEIGMIVRLARDSKGTNSFLGLAVIRKEFAKLGVKISVADNPISIVVEHIFEPNGILNGNNNHTR